LLFGCSSILSLFQPFSIAFLRYFNASFSLLSLALDATYEKRKQVKNHDWFVAFQDCHYLDHLLNFEIYNLLNCLFPIIYGFSRKEFDF